MQCDKKGDSEISESPFLLVMIIGTYLYWTNFQNSSNWGLTISLMCDILLTRKGNY